MTQRELVARAAHVVEVRQTMYAGLSDLGYVGKGGGLCVSRLRGDSIGAFCGCVVAEFDVDVAGLDLAAGICQSVSCSAGCIAATC